MKNRKPLKAEFKPVTTLIITAYNEEKRIKSKLENSIALDYPHDKLQIIVASDGSDDGTNDIVKQFHNKGVELLDVKSRGGKENAQREAVKIAAGEILVFSDVATILETNGLKEIVANFADPTVGCVSSEDRMVSKDGKVCGEGLYVRYEMWLRKLEAQINSLVGLSGSFFAARKEVCQDFAADMQSDFRTLLSSMRIGLRGVCDADAIGYYQDIADKSKEFDRKVRTVLRGITVFFRNKEFLNPICYGFFSYQYFCHKLLRWLVPLFLAGAYLSNAACVVIAQSFLWQGLLAIQTAFYLAALFSWFMREDVQTPLLKVPYYFMTVNLAIAVAWYRYCKGDRLVMWTPSKR